MLCLVEEPCVLQIGVLGLNFKTADLPIRETIARRAQLFCGDRRVFFGHPTVVLSTCNRTEIYFSGGDLASIQSNLLQILRADLDLEDWFDHRLYSYFGIDCFTHLCRVAAGLDSAILGESEIQGQIKQAYLQSVDHFSLPSCLHFAFQKALKIGKDIRSSAELRPQCPTLASMIWQIAGEFWENLYHARADLTDLGRARQSQIEASATRGLNEEHHCRVGKGDEKDRFGKAAAGLNRSNLPAHGISGVDFLLVGFSEINRSIASFLQKKKAGSITFCTRSSKPAGSPYSFIDRSMLSQWDLYQVVICASKANQYLIQKPSSFRRLVFDLSVPRNVDPAIGNPTILYNIEQINRRIERERSSQLFDSHLTENYIRKNVLKLARIYRESRLIAASSQSLRNRLTLLT